MKDNVQLSLTLWHLRRWCVDKLLKRSYHWKWIQPQDLFRTGKHCNMLHDQWVLLCVQSVLVCRFRPNYGIRGISMHSFLSPFATALTLCRRASCSSEDLQNCSWNWGQSGERTAELQLCLGDWGKYTVQWVKKHKHRANLRKGQSGWRRRGAMKGFSFFVSLT